MCIEPDKESWTEGGGSGSGDVVKHHANSTTNGQCFCVEELSKGFNYKNVHHTYRAIRICKNIPTRKKKKQSGEYLI